MTMKVQAYLKYVKRPSFLFGRLFAGERKIIFAVIAALALLAALPMALVFINRADGQYISGFEKRSSDDLAVYFSYIDQAKRGTVFLKDMFTSEEEAFGVFNLVWWGLGRTAGIFSLPAQDAFHLFRIIFIPVLVFSVYFAISFFLKEAKDRRLALLLVVFGSGLGGWLAPHLGKVDWSASGYFSAPLDLSVPEFSIFFSTLASPHFILSWVCLVLSAPLITLAFEELSLKKAASAGLLGLVFFSFHPYYAPFLFVFAALLFIPAAVQSKTLMKPAGVLAIYLVLSSLSILYHIFLTVSDPVVTARMLQNLTWSPPPIMVLAGLGFFIPLSVIGAVTIKKDFRSLSLLFWATLPLVFLYLPWAGQRRFAEGWFLPLSVLSVYGIKELGRRFEPLTSSFGTYSRKFVAVGLFFLVFAYSNYCILRSNIYFNSFGGAPIYLERNFVSAIGFLGMYSGGVVIASPKTARFIPYISGRKVYAGHWAETIFREEKYELIKKFYSVGPSDLWRKNFLERNGIGLIFWGASERVVGDWDPRGDKNLKEIYADGENYVFAVKDR